MAEVLLVIWTQRSRKPSDREISVSVSERANGKRQQENEQSAAAPGLGLEMEPRNRMGSPAEVYSSQSLKGADGALYLLYPPLCTMLFFSPVKGCNESTLPVI